MSGSRIRQRVGVNAPAITGFRLWYHDSEIAIGGGDGNWWVNWDDLARAYADTEQQAPTSDPRSFKAVCHMLMAMRGHGLREITKDQAIQLANQWGSVDVKFLEESA